ncbi:exopolysaccharide biosynthesis polyprenyl glycosylphosphotransferase [Cupriavidus pauculus]|uniref:exopolysaccharide biosynthesis polyprenyl glycosylphosphotransferase n=1 Tax=Cupriavidus pauculus TaxID=82633 RepID=UPI000785FB91|nr:exopolysaccharide biosynthesis polyprenyl glycosylphosphotransferase [Cupriavidus pauculus]MBY4731320.1 exopolysaccharide biosynthesis polyprenyl glycosylphosphotransferase [Cupriavidus pauculus]
MNTLHTGSLRRNGSGTQARSETIRRASRMIAWAAVGLVLFGINAALSEAAHQAGFVTYIFPRTLLWSMLPYLAAFLLVHRALHLPAMEGASIVGVAATLPFALLLIVYAGLHIEYSRGAVLVGYITTLAWTWLGYRRYVQKYVPVFGYIDPETLQHLNRIIAMPGANPPATTRFEQIGSPEEAMHCDGILVERGLTADPARTRLLTQYRLGHLRMYSVERIGEMLTGRVGLDHIDENFFDDYADHYLFDYVKRLTDIVAVIALAPLAIPVGLAVALAVCLESPGGALFRQRRVGLFGKPFTMLKFRSMGVDNHAPAQFALHQDPRVTRVGRFIRKYRLDEIPQLWNVLVGDMSFIGPRPEQVPMVEEFSETIAYYPYRHLVRPGLSGWAQVQQGYVGTHAETVTKLSYDLYYVKHCSFALDLLIAVKTIRTLLTGYGAR